jgi:hypothetical protein
VSRRRRGPQARLYRACHPAMEVDGWQHKLSRVSQNRAAVHSKASDNDRCTTFLTWLIFGRPSFTKTTIITLYKILMRTLHEQYSRSCGRELARGELKRAVTRIRCAISGRCGTSGFFACACVQGFWLVERLRCKRLDIIHYQTRRAPKEGALRLLSAFLRFASNCGTTSLVGRSCGSTANVLWEFGC